MSGQDVASQNNMICKTSTTNVVDVEAIYEERNDKLLNEKKNLRILFICPLLHAAGMPFAMESIMAFAERGHFVDVLVSAGSDPAFQFNHPNIRTLTYPTWQRGRHYLSSFMMARVLASKDRYNLTVGFSQMGLMTAAHIKKHFGIPCIFFNDEISFGNERDSILGNVLGNITKYYERIANREVLFTVTQDARRARLLAKVNHIPIESIRYLPNSYSGAACLLKSKYIHELFNFPPEKKIILWIGGVSFEAGALALARDAVGWPETFGLVFHFRSQSIKRRMDELMKFQGKGQVYISNSVLPYAEVDRLVASATIGLGLYPTGNVNIEEMWSASGKINGFLRRGVPCIVSKLKGLRWVENSGAGICIDNALNVFESAKKITADYDTYQKKSLDVFESYLSFDKHFNVIMKEIEKTLFS